ncbi:hypothetical protein BJ912DRAFT_957541 [Pholiota molesta]|nr:hypothetical protein BJ912DRAFT_957541 [Pholiota molesta]
MLGRIFPLNRCYASSSSTLLSRRLYSSQKPLVRSGHNQAIVDLLVRSLQEEERKPDFNPFKLNAFSKAIESILAVDWPIRSGNDVHAIQGIGPGIVKRINDHLLRQYVDDVEADSDRASYDQMMKSQVATTLQTVPGIGHKKAAQLVEAGCDSLDDLMSGKFNSMLSPKQLLNIKYATHLHQPILRKDAEYMLYQFTLVGDYRRGLESFTDIEIMVSHPSFVHVPLPADPPPGMAKPAKVKDATPKPRKRRKVDQDTPSNILHSELVPFLERTGTVCTALSSKFESWKGIVRLPGPDTQWGTPSERISAIKRVEGQFRRLMFHIVSQRSIGSGLLSLTGNLRFENYLRYRARKKGMLLNEHGIWRWTRHQESLVSDMTESSAEPSEESKRTEEPRPTAEFTSHGYWSLIKTIGEEDIFRELGMDYLHPARRNFTPMVKPQAPKDDDFDYFDYS